VATREVRYTVYGENLELSLKLMCCHKNLNLIDKKDPKARRMFITAVHQQKLKESGSQADLEKAAKPHVPDG
jgi:hypothetical protein